MAQGLAEQHFHSYENPKKKKQKKNGSIRGKPQKTRRFSNVEFKSYRRDGKKLQLAMNNCFSDMFLSNFWKLDITFHEKSARTYSTS